MKLFAVLLAFFVSLSCAHGAVRIKDVASVKGVRENQLVGYGLVVGLQGTGDTLQNAPFTGQSLQAMMDRMGVNVRSANLRTRNVAAVMVTAELPPFAAKGTRIDVTVSSLGDASSLMGGTLLLTTLTAADGQVYAVSQGAVAVTGFNAQGQGETLTQGVPTTGRVPNGATVERELLTRLGDQATMSLELRNPDFSTAVRIADAINAYSAATYRRRTAREDSPNTVTLQKPPGVGATHFIAEIGELLVEPDAPARVVRRRPHRHGGDRPGRSDYARRRDAGGAHRAHHRDAAGVAARAVLEGQDGGDAADRRSTPGRAAAPSPCWAGGPCAAWCAGSTRSA